MENWFVRVRGRILGPFGLSQLHEMRERGQLQSFFEVSTDRVTWQTAGSVDGLFPQAAVVRASPESAPAHSAPEPARLAAIPARRRSSPVLVIAIVGILGVIGILGVVVALLVFL